MRKRTPGGTSPLSKLILIGFDVRYQSHMTNTKMNTQVFDGGKRT